MRKLILFMTLCGLLAAYAPADNNPPENGAQESAEIVSLRTERSETFDNHDGAFVTKVYSKRKYHYKDGMYRNVDLSTEVEVKDGFTRVVSAGPYIYRFDPDDKNKGYRFEKKGYYVTYSPAGDWTGATSTETPTTRGVKEEIALTSESNAGVSWNVDTNALVSFTDGVLTFMDSAGTFLFYVTQPWAQDAEGNEVRVTADFSDDILTYSLELSDIVLWPVIIDPSTNVSPAVDGTVAKGGTTVWADVRDATNGTNIFTDKIRIDQYYDAGVQHWIARGFLSFPISIPVGATVDSTKLYLNGEADYSTTDYDIYTIEGTQTGPISTDDYSKFTGRATGAPHTSIVRYGELWNTADYSADWNTIKFIASGNSAIEDAIGDTLRIAMIAENDSSNVPSPDTSRLFFNSSEDAGEEPYITIWYSTPGTKIQPSYDGSIYNSGETWPAERDGSGGESLVTTQFSLYDRYSGITYFCSRGFLNIPISLGANAIVDSAKLKLYYEMDYGSDFYIYLIEGTQDGAVDLTDYIKFTGRQTGSPHTPVYYADSTSAVTSDIYWKFNSTGNSAIESAEGDTLRLCVISSPDLGNVAPTSNNYRYYYSTSESGSEPYLEVWHHRPPVEPPTNFVMTALDSTTIVCSWNDQSDNEDKFYIMNLADSTVVDSTAANAVADTVSGLNWNTKYVWMAVADSSGVRGYSTPDSAYTLLPAPEACDITIFPISSDTLRIKLTEPVNPTTGETGMEVYAVSGYGATDSGWLTGSYSYLDGGLIPDSTYVYKARYRNAEGDSTAWSPDITYSMNGLDTLIVYLGNDSYDDYNTGFGSGRTDSTVVRAGASNSGERLDGFFSFDLPWRVEKGGVDSLFLSLTRTDEQSAGTPVLKLYGIPEIDIDPVEELNLGAQDSTGVTVNWTIGSGEGEKTSPDIRIIFRAWQNLADRYGFQHGFGLRLDDNAQADSVRAVFLDASNPSYSNGTKLTIYYTPGEPDLLDGRPDDFAMTVIGPDSLRAEWSDNSTTEYGYLLYNQADSTVVAGVDSLDADAVNVDVGGLTPNTVYEWYVKAYTVYDDSTSSSCSERTLARVPGIPTVYALSDTTLRFIVDPQDNPSWTAFAVQDSITGKYVDGTAEPDTLRSGSLGEWGWKTYSQWGSAAGDTLTGLKPDSLYVIRVKARSEE